MDVNIPPKDIHCVRLCLGYHQRRAACQSRDQEQYLYNYCKKYLTVCIQRGSQRRHRQAIIILYSVIHERMFI